MHKKVVLIGFVIALFIGASMVYLLVTDETKTAKQDMISRDDTAGQSAPQNPPASETTGVYIDFEEGIIERTEGTKLLFFHAPWCPQCRMLDADIKAEGLPAGVTIIKVDYDTSQSLRQKYGVTLQTTIVRIDDQGELAKKFVAYDDPSVAAVVENVL